MKVLAAVFALLAIFSVVMMLSLGVGAICATDLSDAAALGKAAVLTMFAAAAFAVATVVCCVQVEDEAAK